jgi:hypothetical protein
MAWQAPGELVENHYGWQRLHTLSFDKGQRADLYLSNGKCLPVAAWSQSQMNLPADYIETRWMGEEVPTICPDYAAMLAESWRGADPEGKTMTRVKALNRWVEDASPEIVRADDGSGVGESLPEETPIPF